jgi:hypothetical protein
MPPGHQLDLAEKQSNQLKEEKTMKQKGKHVTYLLLFFLAQVLVGCGTEVGLISHPTPVATVKTMVVPIAPFITVNFCDDVTTSNPRVYFDQARQLMAQWTEQLVRPAEAGANVFVQWINHNSYEPESTIQIIVVPSLPANPTPPNLIPYPTPSDTGNPFEGATATATSQQAIATVKAANNKAQADYQGEMSNQRARLKRAGAMVKEETQKLINLTPDPDNMSSDIWGCIQRASERLQAVGGKKFLIIASDMEMTGPQEHNAVQQLQGVTVILIFYYCEHAQPCSDKTAYWQAAFKRSEAAAIHFFEPSQSLTLKNPLLA